MGIPDREIHPVATGRAKGIVDRHQKEEPLKFYGSWFCPFVQRAWLVLEIKKIPYQWVEINPYNKDPSFLALNPRGLVPTLEYDSKPLYESNIICELLEDAYPKYGPKLLPEGPYERAYIRLWVDFVGSRIVPAYHRYLQYTKDAAEKDGVSFEEELAKKREELLGTLKTWMGSMKDGESGFYMGGKEPTLVDTAMAPWLQRLWVLDHYKGPFSIPETDEWKRWHSWKKAVEGIPSYSETESDREHFYQIYKRYSENTAQSEAAKAIREGRAIP
jgi:glutathione S-transferase